MIEYDLPMKGQAYIQDCKTKVLREVSICVNLLPSSIGKDEIISELTKIITNNFKSLEQ